MFDTDAVLLQNALVQECTSLPSNQPRKHLLEISNEPDSKCRRFAKPLSSTEIDDHCNPCVPKSTKSNTTWGVCVFNEWVKARNSGASHGNVCPRDLLIHSHPISVIDYWLAAFVLEARRRDGNYYSGNTIRNILAALFRFLKENVGVKSAPNLIDRGQREANFLCLHNALDCHLKMLRNMSIDTELL